jgi:hypothetical protein
MANVFNSAADKIHEASSKAAMDTAKAWGQHIQEHIETNDQIDTRFMYESVYYISRDESTYSQAIVKAPEKALPEIAAPDSPTSAYVALAAPYAGDQNYGTIFQDGRPFFEPAGEDTKQDLDNALIKLSIEITEVPR